MKLYRCPLCGTPTVLSFCPEQAFCTNEDCVVVTFNPSLPDGGLSEAQEIKWEPVQDDER